jgi:hypothetical protein
MLNSKGKKKKKKNKNKTQQKCHDVTAPNAL